MLATGIPYSVLVQEEPAVIATCLEIDAEIAAKAAQRG